MRRRHHIVGTSGDYDRGYYTGSMGQSPNQEESTDYYQGYKDGRRDSGASLMGDDVDEDLYEAADENVRRAVDKEVEQNVDAEIARLEQQIIREGIMPPMPDVVDNAPHTTTVPTTTTVVGGFWNNVLGVAHLAGSAVLSIFGAGDAAKQIGKAEGGALPDWAGGPQSQAGGASAAPTDPSLDRGTVTVRPSVRSTSQSRQLTVAQARQAAAKARQPTISTWAPTATPDVALGRDNMRGDDIWGDEAFEVLGEEIVNDLRATDDFSAGGRGYTVGSHFAASPSDQAVMDLATSHYLVGTDVCGAPPPKMPTKPIVKPLIKKVVQTAKAAAGKKSSPHVDALDAAKQAASHAQKSADAATKAVKKYDATAHTTVIPMAKVAVRGTVVLGTDRPLSAKQTQAVQRHVDALAKTKVKVEVAKKQAARATQVAQAAAAAVAKATPTVKKFIPSGHAKLNIVTMHGDGVEVVGGDDWVEIVGGDMASDLEYLEIVGTRNFKILGEGDGSLEDVIYGDLDYLEIVGQSPDPNNPGFLTDGSPDPAYGAAGSGDGGYVPDTYTPPVRDQPLSQDDARTAMNSVPADGVVYDGSQRGMPSDMFGSYTIMYGGGFHGIDGKRHADDGGSGSGVSGTAWVNEKSGEGLIWHQNPGENTVWWAIRGGHGDSQSSGEDTAKKSMDFGWGPLIGNPTGDFKGLQWATTDQKWFWQADKAPTWATQEADAKLKLLFDQTQAANKAAADADAARIAQEQAMMDEAQAKQDAASALAQQQSDTDAAVAQQKLDSQQAAVMAQLDAQQAQQGMAAEAAQQAFDQKAQQAQLDYAIAHPDEVMQQQPQQGGDDGGDDGGGGWSSSDTTDRNSVEDEMNS